MYDNKTPAYFSNPREEIIDLLPDTVLRVLEVGCGTGETLSIIKSKFPNSMTVGIELCDVAAALAMTKVDVVHNLDIEDAEGRLSLGQFDLILLLDVLEHLRNPWAILKSLVSENLCTGGTVITSIPNARNHSLVVQLLQGEFRYTESGVLDKTHLRFFTKKTMARLIEKSGLNILECLPTNTAGESRSALLNRFSCGLLEEFFAVQYIMKSAKLGE